MVSSWVKLRKPSISIVVNIQHEQEGEVGRWMERRLTPPPATCQLTAIYFPPAVTKLVSQADPLIFAFS